jgi:hypothetical protein
VVDDGCRRIDFNDWILSELCTKAQEGQAMRIGGFYKNKDGYVYRMKGFTVSLFAADKVSMRIDIEELFQLYPENAYSYRHPIDVTIPLAAAAEKTEVLMEKLKELIENFLRENYPSASDEEPETPSPTDTGKAGSSSGPAA